jgi:O-antigen ligase
MIRLSALWCVVIFVGAYAWKDWFRGLCGLVLLIGILEYPDVPKSIFGVTGLNFFNLLLINVFFAWQAQRIRERLTWDMPAHINVMLLMYLTVLLIGFYRMYSDPGLMQYTETKGSMIAEYLINTLKWPILALLLFDGCRSRERLLTGIGAILGAYLFLGFMTLKVMPLGAALMDGNDLQKLALRLLLSRIGYHRVTLSMMLGGAAWALIGAMPIIEDARLRRMMPILAVVMVYAQSLTGGRAGYITTGAVGLIMGALRWRKVFLIGPAVAVLILMFVPAAADRLLNGFGSNEYNSSVKVDEYEITSGRNLIWPYVIAQINRKPWFGWGRQAMIRTGTVNFLAETLKEDFGHPHNAYLEAMLDNGIVGTFFILLLFLTFLIHAFRLFLEKRSALCMAAGGVASALILALLVASMGSQSFYPVEGTVEMWAAIGLMLAVSVERKRALARANLIQAPGAVVKSWSPTQKVLDLDAYLWPNDATAGQFRPAVKPVTIPAINPAFNARPTVAASWKQRTPVSGSSVPTVRFRF